MTNRLYIPSPAKAIIEEFRRYRYPVSKVKRPVVYDHEYDPLFWKLGLMYGGIDADAVPETPEKVSDTAESCQANSDNGEDGAD